jgi:hypothetical protein
MLIHAQTVNGVASNLFSKTLLPYALMEHHGSFGKKQQTAAQRS